MGVLLASRSFEIFAIRILILERGAIKGPGTPPPPLPPSTCPSDPRASLRRQGIRYHREARSPLTVSTHLAI